MKKILLGITLLLGTITTAQTTATFESFNLGVDSALNGSDQQGGFQDGNLFFPNTYDTQFNSWFGFSVSSKTDVSTAGFTNDLSCIAGEGAEDSNTYGVAFMSYLSNNVVAKLNGPALGGALEGMYVNNSTYAYLSMRDGDAVAKKFGGISGDDPDFFLLTIQKYKNGNLSSDKIEFYLADFRFSNNADDYIIDEWTYIDLSSLGNADSLAFSLSSSDVGQFGMNTPSYFCLDNIQTKDGLSTGIGHVKSDLDISIYPNPTQDYLSVKNVDHAVGQINLYDFNGALIMQEELRDINTLNVKGLSQGTYIVDIQVDGVGSQSYSFVKI